MTQPEPPQAPDDLSWTVPPWTLRVGWSEPDREYVATCDAFGSLSWLAPRPEQALSGLAALITIARADLAPEEQR